MKVAFILGIALAMASEPGHDYGGDHSKLRPRIYDNEAAKEVILRTLRELERERAAKRWGKCAEEAREVRDEFVKDEMAHMLLAMADEKLRQKLFSPEPETQFEPPPALEELIPPPAMMEHMELLPPAGAYFEKIPSSKGGTYSEMRRIPRISLPDFKGMYDKVIKGFAAVETKTSRRCAEDAEHALQIAFLREILKDAAELRRISELEADDGGKRSPQADRRAAQLIAKWVDTAVVQGGPHRLSSPPANARELSQRQEHVEQVADVFAHFSERMAPHDVRQYANHTRAADFYWAAQNYTLNADNNLDGTKFGRSPTKLFIEEYHSTKKTPAVATPKSGVGQEKEPEPEPVPPPKPI